VILVLAGGPLATVNICDAAALFLESDPAWLRNNEPQTKKQFRRDSTDPLRICCVPSFALVLL